MHEELLLKIKILESQISIVPNPFVSVAYFSFHFDKYQFLFVFIVNRFFLSLSIVMLSKAIAIVEARGIKRDTKLLFSD